MTIYRITLKRYNWTGYGLASTTVFTSTSSSNYTSIIWTKHFMTKDKADKCEAETKAAVDILYNNPTSVFKEYEITTEEIEVIE